MSKTLVIVESPAKAKTINRYLGKDFDIIASVGHIRDLPSSTMGVDVNNNFKPRYINMKGKEKVIKELKEKYANHERTLIATDPDREGEAIAWHIANILGVDPKSECRITFNEITKNAVKQAVEHPRTIDLDLVDAQQARRILDRLVGYELSPLLWKKIKKGLSAGRVQSVATLMLVEREEAINKFIPEEFWTLSVDLATKRNEMFNAQFKGILTADGKVNKHPLPDERSMLAIKDKCIEPYVVRKVTKRTKHRNPYAPFTTSTLQQEASRKLGFAAKRTMLIAQQLYEGIDLPELGSTALVTYIRTDSVRSSADAVDQIRTLIKNEFGEKYLPAKANFYVNKNASQDAHEAIRPTHFELNPEKVKPLLSIDQFKLYRLIWERFVASQMIAAEIAVTSVDIQAGEIIFHTSGEVILFPGFLQLNPDKIADKDTKELPLLTEGEVLQKLKMLSEQKFTQPPARYNEASLIKAMEEAGIGRPSTYAPTLSTIIDRQYAIKENKALMPTELGTLVTNILKEYFAKFINIKFTAYMEDELDDVESGKLNWVNLMHKFYPEFHAAILNANENISKIEMPIKETGEVCPECGNNLVIKEGRFGKFIACSSFPTCKFTKNIVEKIDAHCPLCGSSLQSRKSKRGTIFYICSKEKDNADCGFISWDLPIDNETCEKCDSYMVWHRFRKKAFKRCSNENCLTRQSKTATRAKTKATSKANTKAESESETKDKDTTTNK